MVTPGGRTDPQRNHGHRPGQRQEVCQLVSVEHRRQHTGRGTAGSLRDRSRVTSPFRPTARRFTPRRQGSTRQGHQACSGGRRPRPLIKHGPVRNPSGVAVDKDGNIYVADKGNNRIAVFKPDGSVLGDFKTDQPRERGGPSGDRGGIRARRTRRQRSCASTTLEETEADRQVNVQPFKGRLVRSQWRWTVRRAAGALGWQLQMDKSSLLRIEDKGAALGASTGGLRWQQRRSIQAHRPVRAQRQADRLLAARLRRALGLSMPAPASA